MYGQVKKDIVDILQNETNTTHRWESLQGLCAYVFGNTTEVQYIRVYVILKGKSTLMLFDRHPEYRSRGDKHFWARGYFVASIGNVNEETIRQYILDQKEKDKYPPI